MLAAAATCFAGAAGAQAASPSSRPNVVLILADDLDLRDLGSFGAKDIRTPHLDRLAHEGVRFTSFYSNGTECSPTRAALLTGRYQHRVGGLECAIGTGNVGRYDDAMRLAKEHDLGLPASLPTLPALLKKAGYATALCGKWHLGYEEKFAPGQHGFDHAFYCVGGGMDYFHHVEDPPQYAPALRLNGQPIKRPGYFTDLVADDAVTWLRHHAVRAGEGTGTAPGQPRPFFLYLPFTAPHSPFQGPDEKDDAPLPADSPRWDQGKAPPAVYAAMIERLDQAVGRVLAALEEQRHAANTLVLFTSDNGGTGSARPTGLRGFKGQTFEGGVRVPCLVRWPGVLPAGTDFAHPALTFDLTASLARAAGVAAANQHSFDGVDILRFAQDGAAPPARALFWRARRGERTWRAVRDGALKYVSRQDGDKVEDWLFDLGRDPAEETSVLAERADDAARLRRQLAAWEHEVRPSR